MLIGEDILHSRELVQRSIHRETDVFMVDYDLICISSPSF